MKAPRVFISYARKDMEFFHWLNRLKLYLAPIQRKGLIDPWDDSRLKTGSKLRDAIDEAIENSDAAIVLLGPGFFASDFIMEREVPALLRAEKKRGLRLYPVVVDWVDYQSSPFEPYLAVNDRNAPLISLDASAQNKILNDLCSRLQDDLPRRPAAALPIAATAGTKLSAVLAEITARLEKTRVVFEAQASRRDVLVELMTKRLKIAEDLEYEIFFLKYHGRMKPTEKAHFDQIRAMTEGTLQKENRTILQLIEENPAILRKVPRLSELRQHLSFWINKYDEFFLPRAGMCVLYTGVEDGVPFPSGIEKDIAKAMPAARGRRPPVSATRRRRPRIPREME